MELSLPAALAGLGFGLSLIVAIGAQNAFVLRQGIAREHVGVVVAICAASDAVLVAAGVAGLGTLLADLDGVMVAIRVAGAAVLLTYAVLAARRAWNPGSLTARGTTATSLRTTVVVCISLTWLNPHVYLDTVVLLGSLSSTYGDARVSFGIGAVLGSLVWFTGLGYGARLLAPLFARPAAWRVLDAFVAATMIVLATSLLLGA
ncbi:L-lysine exporter family protein LysE/ArgO [Mumia flava]|uniref:L-lysine exporter family protein LysE/ArgO n=1 Tax=Mumia flava TaxID=1348852 RepID=A0A0B2BG84_9ACTN|nr:LysE/ArgO family amino acid transporter [Mumia flava]PJJ56436.1 L-lysine exporter family protein LysE/ArgO [Mumia flava]